MGTYYTNGALGDDIIRECLAERKTLAHRIVGANLWTVKEYTMADGTIGRIIVLYLLKGHRDGWGYKPVSEDMGPYETNCPLALLTIAVPPPDGYAVEWRERVHAAHEANSAKRAAIARFTVGQKVQLVPGCKPQSVTLASLKPLRGYDDTGRLYRINPRHVAQQTA